MIAVESSRVKFHLAGGAQPLILLPVSVNGQGPFEFILDTGAGTSLLSPELAQKIGATSFPRNPARRGDVRYTS